MKNVYDPFFKGSFIFHPQFCKNTQTVSARGVRKLFRNNDRCLLAEVFDVSNGTENKERAFEYDALKRLTRATYYHNGNYTGSVFGLDTYCGFQHTDNVYDERSRLVERTFSDGASVTLSYDPDSNLKSLTGTDQQATRFTYYRDGLLNEVRVETESLPDKVFKYHYDAAGRLERLDYPGESGLTLYLSDANSTTPGSGYDANGNLLHMRYEINGVPVRSFHYTYDKSGNRETLEIITPSKTSLYQFGYDWFDRLTTVSLGINGAPPALLRVYELDEADNRRFFDDYAQGTNGATYYYKYKGHGAYSSDQVEAIYIYPGAAGHRNVEDFVQLHEALEYDDDGNLTKRTKSNGEIISLDWTTYDRLEKISSSTRNELQESRYGADGLRLRKLDSGALSTDPNEKVIVREDGLGITTSNVRPLSKQSSPAEPRKSPVRYMQGHAILGFQRDGSSYYFLTDALGTVYDILRDDRQIVQSYEYTEHGGLVSQSTDFRSEKTFVGALSVHDDLPDSGLYLMGHRHYDSNLGRFVSRDPIGFAGGLNLYAYGRANPIQYVDPRGTHPIIIPNPDNPSEMIDITEYHRHDPEDLAAAGGGYFATTTLILDGLSYNHHVYEYTKLKLHEYYNPQIDPHVGLGRSATFNCYGYASIATGLAPANPEPPSQNEKGFYVSYEGFQMLFNSAAATGRIQQIPGPEPGALVLHVASGSPYNSDTCRLNGNHNQIPHVGTVETNSPTHSRSKSGRGDLTVAPIERWGGKPLFFRVSR